MRFYNNMHQLLLMNLYLSRHIDLSSYCRVFATVSSFMRTDYMMMMMMMRGLRIRTIIGRYGSVRRHAMASMSNVEDDTIFSLASGQGRAGVAVLRISGPLSTDALSEMTNGKKLPDPRVATVRNLKSTYDGSILDRAMILRFEKPKSFTGEDVVEFHLHGGPAVVVRSLSSLFVAHNSNNNKTLYTHTTGSYYTISFQYERTASRTCW